MKILVVGGGGREHAIAWKIARSPLVTKLYCAPGNPGISSVAECIDIAADDLDGLKDFALQNQIDLTVVGPEQPLTLGIVDIFKEHGLRIFGPDREAARLEGSKIFAKNIMKEAGIPTAAFSEFSDPAAAHNYVSDRGAPLVIKADGLAAGKGVFPCRTTDEAHLALDRIMLNKEFGEAGDTVIVEDFLVGEEASFICFSDGKTVMPLPSSQDHKPVFDGDQGPNTGGMGAYSPAPIITPQLHEKVMQQIMHPLIKTLAVRGITFKGIIYAGLMISGDTFNVLEFNVRFGDPETQPILYRLETDLVQLFNAVIDEKLSTISVACDPQPAICVVMASRGYPGSYRKGFEITGLEQAARLPSTIVFHAGTATLQDKIINSGGRVLGVTAKGETITAAIKNAYAAVEMIDWDGAQFRKDIAGKALKK